MRDLTGWLKLAPKGYVNKSLIKVSALNSLYSYFRATDQSLHVLQSPVAPFDPGRPSAPAAVEEGPGVR